MKKSILILTLILTFSFIFSVTVFASDNTVTLSDDYCDLYYNGELYSRANTDSVNLDIYADGFVYVSNFVYEEPDYVNYVNYVEKLNIELSESQKEELARVYVRSIGEEQLFITAELNFKDGSIIWYSYVRDDVKSDFEKVSQGQVNEFVVDYITYSDQNDIVKTVSKENLLTGNKKKINYLEYNEFDVTVFSENFNYSIYKGVVFIGENEYYYFDFDENGIKDIFVLYELNITELEAHKITDEETIAKLEEGLQEYYDADYGYLYNDELTEVVSKLFFTIVFAIFPVIIAVITFIFAVKSKKLLYKKLLFTTSGLSLATLSIFVYLAFILLNK